MPERPLNERIYRVLVVIAVALWIQALVNLPAALFNASFLVDALFGGFGPGPAD
jgi:hypothetical protein